MVKSKKQESNLSIDMQFVQDISSMMNCEKQKTKKYKHSYPTLDMFNNSKPKDNFKTKNINNLVMLYLQLSKNKKKDKNIEVYTAIKNGQFIPLKTYITVKNNFNTYDEVKNSIQETMEIFGKCPQCNVQFVTINECTYCPNCYLETSNISAKDTSSTNGVDKFKSTYIYKRVSHYINKLDKLVACENTKIPQEIIDMIYDETRKEHRNINDINVSRIKYYLTKYNYSKYSDNVNQIYKIITGKQIIFIPPIIRNILIENFTKIDQVLSQMTEQEGNLNNFLNYSYLHYKICEHLNLKKYQYLFPLCKSQDKIYSHDAIWKIICNKIGWKFIPTI